MLTLISKNLKKYRQANEPRIEAVIADGSALFIDKEGNKLSRRTFEDGEKSVKMDLSRPVTLARCKEICEKFNIKKMMIMDWRFFDLENDKEYSDEFLSEQEGGYYFTSKKEYHYDHKNNSLIIWQDGEPIYSNDNGVTCNDTVALADTLNV